MSWVDRTKFLSCLTICLSLTLLFLPREAFAACDGTTGTVTCTGSITSTIGTGPNSTITTLNIASGASVNTSGLSVSTGSGASADNRNVINVNGSLQSAGNNRGPWNEGRNVVEFKDYTVVNISSTGSIVQTNTATNTGGISAIGGGNIVNNYGTLRTGGGAIFYAETNNSSTNTVANTINNYGTMTSGAQGTGVVIGTGVANPINFTNFEGGVVNGNISLRPSSTVVNIVTLYNGSTFNGSILGGGDPSILNLTGFSGSNTLSNATSLFGTLNKSGAGTWVVNVPSTLSSLSSNLAVNVNGGTLIFAANESSSQTHVTINEGGTLQLGQGGTTGWIDNVNVNNGTLAFNRSDNNSYTNNISGSGAVTQSGTGTTTLRDSNSYSGGTSVANGTLKGTASSFGAGGINIGGNGSLMIDQASDVSMSNSFSGSGAMSKIGSGNVTLNSNSPDFSGQVDVLAGGLGIDGNIFNARFNAQDSGTIYGTGSIGPTTVGNGGTLAPGGPGAIGTLSVNGELSMGAGSIFSATGTGQEVGTSINVDGSSRNILASSFVNVSGNVSLAGGTAALNVASGSILRVNQVYRLIEATGNISGQFDQLSTNLGSQYVFLDPSLFYTDKLVGVALNRNNTSFTILSRSRNEYASGAALDRLPSGNPLSLAVAGLDINDARSALNAASGEIHASAVTALIEDAFMLRETVAERLSSADCDGPYSSGSIQTAALSEKAPSNRCHADRLVLWHQAYGSLGRNFDDGNAATMNHTSAGFLMGADVPIFNTARVGALIGYSNDSFHVSSGRDSSGHSNNVTIGAYGGNHWGRINLRLGANYTWNMMRMNRAVNFNGYNGAKLNADYLSGTAQGFGEIGYHLRGRKIAFEPFAGLSYVSVHSGSFREKGSVEALEGRSFTKGVTFSTFGIRSSASYQMGKTILMPRLMIGYRHSFGSLSPTATMRFAASDDAAMRIAGTPLASDVAVVDAGFNLRVTDQIDVGLFYLGQYGVKATDSGLKGSLRVTF